MVVIYAEKSSLAKEIAKALGAGKRIALKEEPTVGYYEFKFNGEDAVLCHGVGHLAQLVPAKSYDEKFAKWDLEVFPCIPDKFRTAPKSATINCIKLVKSFFDKADWLINATDPDREGELIFTYVYEVCKCQKPFKRVWIEDLTDQKIKKAFNNLKKPDERLSEQVQGNANDLQLAGRARDISDWLIGNNLTVAVTKKFGGYNNLLSVGRVQTPTLALVVNREKDILNHVKTPFWRLSANFSFPNVNSFEAEYEKGTFKDENEAKSILNQCENQKGTVISLETKHRQESAPLLFNATQLQVTANRKLSWDADKTTKIMQSLYEKKLMSYPRTSSEHLTEAMIPEVTLTIQKLLKLPEYSQYNIQKWQDFTKRHFDDKKVGSHPAIIPTVNVPDDFNNLSDDEKTLYDLLAKSIIRMIYPKAEIDDTTTIINVNGHNFKASGSIITNQGWYAVDAVPDKKKVLPQISQGQELNGEYKLKKGETEPPKRYTEAELLNAMELAGQKIDDEETRTLMKLQKKGLGTDATRVPIIKSLFDKEYIAKKGKSIYPTEKGIFLINTLPVDDLKSADMTGELEKTLNDIALGKSDYNAFIEHIKKITKEWYDIIVKSEKSAFISENDKNMICPICGKKINTFDWGYGCSGYKEGCKFRVSKNICGKKISENHIAMISKKGETNLIKGFKSKSGNEFDACLVLNKEKGTIEFKFADKK